MAPWLAAARERAGRCHSARGNLPPVRERDDPPVVDLMKQKIVCDSDSAGT
jgi:hypothetical protein